MPKEDKFDEACAELLKEVKKKKKNFELDKTKKLVSKKHHLDRIPKNIDVLFHLQENNAGEVKELLITKPTRTISGVTVVAIMTKPIPCPHKTAPCIYCPGGVNSTFGDVPQSYTGKEPAAMRAIRNNYDPYLQVMNRLEHYVALNQSVNKVEIIIMGGTFSSFPKKYQENFVKYAFKAMNDFSKLFFNKSGKFNLSKFKEFFELPGQVGDKKRLNKVTLKLKKIKGKCSLEAEKKKNEKANVRCVALCIETRPDYCKKEHIDEMLKLGCTRVEIGVQHLDNKILKNIKRGHNVEETIKATKLLKDSFLKVGYHIMLGLPGSSVNDDEQMLRKLFSDSNFRPDALKIYPCMVVKGTKLHKLWLEGRYKPLTTEKAAKLIANFKKYVPEWCRILRIQRDIPTHQTEAGVNATNLRQLIHEKYNVNCRCIRCREPRNKKIDLNNLKILEREYKASGGIELFISAEDMKNNILLGFCRARIAEKLFGIRELHVYGESTELGKRGKIQHRGIGRALLKKAEEIALKRGFKIVYVISGVGAREYYRHLGYKLDKKGIYIVKSLLKSFFEGQLLLTEMCLNKIPLINKDELTC